jgi:exopolysaccharide biosynthesis operon protein EpsL
MPQDMTRIRGRLVAGVAAIAIGQLYPVTAFTAPEDPVNFIVGTSLRYEDNLFRLAPSVDPLVVLGRAQRSDWISSTYAGIKVDKPYSLQRFLLNATVTTNRYDTFSYLNATTNDYRAAWLWSLTPHLTGELSSEQQQFAASYADFRNFTARNVQTNTIQRANFDWSAGAGWHVLGGFSESRSKNTSVFTAVGDFTMDTVSAGIKYESTRGNSVTVEHRNSRGEYLGRVVDPILSLDNRFRHTETDVEAKWQAGARSLVVGKIGYVERVHANFPSRDFSGGVARLAYLWTPTEKLSFNLAAGHNLYSFQELANSYYSLDYLTLTPAWAVGPRTTLKLKLDVSHRQFKGPVIPAAILREETIRSAQLSADWAITRTATLSGFFLIDDRSSNIAAFEYRANTAGVTAQLKF